MINFSREASNQTIERERNTEREQRKKKKCSRLKNAVQFARDFLRICEQIPGHLIAILRAAFYRESPGHETAPVGAATSSKALPTHFVFREERRHEVHALCLANCRHQRPLNQQKIAPAIPPIQSPAPSR